MGKISIFITKSLPPEKKRERERKAGKFLRFEAGHAAGRQLLGENIGLGIRVLSGEANLIFEEGRQTCQRFDSIPILSSEVSPGTLENDG